MPRPRLSDRKAMELAIAKAREGIERGQSPFGCVLVRRGRLLACCHNTVWQECDPSAHAEVNAIRQACLKLGTIDLSGTVMYATCEPCPMCFSAAHWARISKIVYGAGIADAARAGFNELRVSLARLRRAGKSSMIVRPGFMAGECRQLFEQWAVTGRGEAY